MLGSLILSAEALAVGVVCVLVRSFMHVRCGSLTFRRRLTMLFLERLISGILSLERLICGICFLDIFLIVWESKYVDLIASMLPRYVCISFFVEDDF